MKISDMTREELRNHMKGNGSIHRPDRGSYEWRQGLKLAKAAGYESWDLDCPKCVDKLKEWILK